MLRMLWFTITAARPGFLHHRRSFRYDCQKRKKKARVRGPLCSNFWELILRPAQVDRVNPMWSGAFGPPVLRLANANLPYFMMQSLPFSAAELDALLDQSGADVLLASSKHNVQYLLGGYRYFFFEHSAAIGLGHYLPVLGYVKGREDLAFYVGGGDEGWGIEVFPIWPERISTVSWDAGESAREAAKFLKSAGLVTPRIALEFEVCPVAAWEVLRAELPGATFVDATEILEELRAVKTGAELIHMRNAAAGIVDSMLATFQWVRPGVTETEIVEHLRVEQTLRGLDYEFTLIATGPTFGRGPSQRKVANGEILSLDTGGRSHGYLADMARMAVLGEPTALMNDLLNEILTIQSAARTAIKAGAPGRKIYETALQTLK